MITKEIIIHLFDNMRDSQPLQTKSILNKKIVIYKMHKICFIYFHFELSWLFIHSHLCHLLAHLIQLWKQKKTVYVHLKIERPFFLKIRLVYYTCEPPPRPHRHHISKIVRTLNFRVSDRLNNLLKRAIFSSNYIFPNN